MDFVVYIICYLQLQSDKNNNKNCPLKIDTNSNDMCSLHRGKNSNNTSLSRLIQIAIMPVLKSDKSSK